MASSSSSVQQKYQVFLSFRGEDTRNNFTSHLYAALQRKGIDTFIDNQLIRGEQISQALLTAIEESTISIIVLSKNYAFSSLCLDELSKILECKQRNRQIVVPIFYHVDPSHVRNQNGSFEEAFAKHQERFKDRTDKMEKWKAALVEVASLAGCHIPGQPNDKLESTVVEEIAEHILKKLMYKSLYDTRIEEIERLLCIDSGDVRIVGIFGMVGIGKTTTAEAVYNRFFAEFDGYSFINVKEELKYGQVHLREKLISEILGYKNPNLGKRSLPGFIKDELLYRKFLIVFDDVDSSMQLDPLPEKHCFGPGSRIIVITRDKQVLQNVVDEIYEVEGLDNNKALQMFSLYAFRQSHPKQNFMVLSKKMVHYAKGVPLALKVLGSSLYGKSKLDWQGALNNLKEIPNLTIGDILRINSYDGYHQPVQEIEPYCLSPYQILNNNVGFDTGSQRTSVSFETCKEQFFTMESSTATADFIAYESPAVSISSNRSPFSTQGSQSCLTDLHHSTDNAYGSPMSGSSNADDDNKLRHKLKELETSMLGPESDVIDNYNRCFKSGVNQATSTARLDLKQVLISCAQAIADHDILPATDIMHVLEQMVSVSGDPIQRLGAYMLEALRARLEFSGSKIYRALKCKEPILYQICPYWKFAYVSANVVIGEAMENEPRIHIIDFQIAEGSQWVPFIQAVGNRPGGPPHVRITCVDDSQTAHAHGGGLHIVGQRLAKVAESSNVLFEFHDTAMSSGCEVVCESLGVRPGEAVAVNVPYILHQIPDESVSAWNNRDRLLRLVKSLSPKVVTLVEQESNTNTTPFYPRFLETLDYYTAMFESIDAGCPRDDKKRIGAEQHCVARDIVNMIACEGEERVERHEVFGKWRSRFSMAGFTPYPLSPSVTNAVRDLLKEYNKNYWIEERDGAIYLGWVNRAMATSSAWR